jgi:hypothetical protein
MADKQDSKKLTVAEMVSTLRKSARLKHAASNRSFGAGTPEPQFTFLAGAGLSIGAGMLSTPEMVSAMRIHEQSPDLQLDDVFDRARKLGDKQLPGDYYELMGDVLGDASGRQAFVTSAVQWAAKQQDPLSEEARLLATLLTAGAGRKAPLWGRCGDILVEEDNRLFGSFARHVFTTNFDEVLPTAFYRRNWPVEVFDRPGKYTIHGNTDYPAIVYLHGRHLHYDLRNIPPELQQGAQRATRQEGDLFTQFRQMLESTGLIIVGYSGDIEDRVIETILQAAIDGGLARHNIYWALYRDESSISHEARQLVGGCPNAYYLVSDDEQPLSAKRLLRQLFEALGANPDSSLVDWWQHEKRIAELARSDYSQSTKGILE